MKSYDFIYFIGDSFTFAMHQSDDVYKQVNAQNRFSALVSKHFDIPEINVAHPGCSNHYIFKKIYEDVHKFVDANKTFLMVITYTSPDRLDLYYNETKSFKPISETFSFFKDYLIESYNPKYNLEVSIEYIWAIHTLLDKLNIDYVEGYTTPIIDIPYAKTEKCLDINLMEIAGTDGRFAPTGHANILGNKRIANYYINKITELYGTN